MENGQSEVVFLNEKLNVLDVFHSPATQKATKIERVMIVQTFVDDTENGNKKSSKKNPPFSPSSLVFQF